MLWRFHNYKIKIFHFHNYSRGSEFVTVPYRTVPFSVFFTVPFSVFFTVPFFTASATVTVPFFSLTVRSAKRTEPFISTVSFLVFDREPHRTNRGTVIRFLLRTANRTAPKMGTVNRYYGGPRTAPRAVPHQNWCGQPLLWRTANRTANCTGNRTAKRTLIKLKLFYFFSL